MSYVRLDGRGAREPRRITVTTGAQAYAEGAALIEIGNTKVLCAASVEKDVPRWRRGSGLGWVTAEYGMLPRATHTRSQREARLGRQGGRSQEIQRLIGRSLRAVTDLAALGERLITVDCDVLQADGGTRTAAITGGWVALHLACAGLVGDGVLASTPVRERVAATSLGYVDGDLLLDLAYNEDSAAESDFNVVMTGSGRFVEIQGSAEGALFGRDQLDEVIGLARRGIDAMLAAQQAALKGLM